VGLSINADKTDFILFTKRYKVPKWTPTKIDATRLTPKTQVKYLGLLLDCKLAWRLNVLKRVKKATVALYASKNMALVTYSDTLGLHFSGASDSAAWSLMCH